MATFKISIQSHQLRTDGKYPVSIRVIWKRKIAYIKTDFYVTSKQIDKHFNLKDPYVYKDLMLRIKQYEDIKVQKLGQSINLYSAKELAEYLVFNSDVRSNEDINFIEFCDEKIKGTKNKGTAGIYQTVVNSLISFTGKKIITAPEITASFLNEYEAYLKVKREMTGTGINLYMRNVRALFYALREKYNDEEKGDIHIPQNPFKKYKIKAAPETQKRALKIGKIRAIRDLKLSLKRDILAQDIFMLSFYLVGMNTVDLYYIDQYENGRLTYSRTKTGSRRQDHAIISIKVEPEALPIMEKYRDKTGKQVFNFYKTYAEPRSFNKAVNIGLKNIGLDEKVLVTKLTYYAARHSWATIARNDCEISKEDVHESLNHADSDMKTTDIYIDKDWSVIDRANRKVIDLLNVKD